MTGSEVWFKIRADILGSLSQLQKENTSALSRVTTALARHGSLHGEGSDDTKASVHEGERRGDEETKGGTQGAAIHQYIIRIILTIDRIIIIAFNTLLIKIIYK